MLLRRRIRRLPLHIWIFICIFRCTFRMSIDVYASSFFVFLFTVPVISYFLLRDVLLRLRVAEEFLFPPDGVHIIYNYSFS